MSWFTLSSFRRITSRAGYLPLIDGFRFIAISWVILHHLHGQFLKKTTLSFNEAPQLTWIDWIANPGYYGVPLFFIISGFILGLPFAKAHIQGEESVCLKKYYLRRLTRLEPPYLIALWGFFMILGFEKGWDYAGSLWPNLLEGTFYLNSLINNSLNPISIVAWSLEIEVQFYLLAPFLTQVFRLPPIGRRSILIAAMVLLSLIPWPGRWHFTFLNYGPYFAGGLLLADLYLNYPKKESHLQWLMWDLSVPILGLFLLWAIHETAWITLVLMLGIMIAIFKGRYWQKALTNIWVTTLGGMCYSIYLIHFPLLAFLGRWAVDSIPVGEYNLYFLIHAALILPGIIITSALFYKLIEQPCMDPTSSFNNYLYGFFGAGPKNPPYPPASQQ